MQRVFGHLRLQALRLDEGGMRQRRLGGQQQREAQRRPGLGAIRREADASQQQQRASAPSARAISKPARAISASWRFGLTSEDPAIRDFGRGDVPGGAIAFGQAHQRLVPAWQDLGHDLHQAAGARQVAGAVLGDGKIEQGGRGGVPECYGGAQGDARRVGLVHVQQRHAARDVRCRACVVAWCGVQQAEGTFGVACAQPRERSLSRHAAPAGER